jgi:hypothetical protein
MTACSIPQPFILALNNLDNIRVQFFAVLPSLKSVYAVLCCNTSAPKRTGVPFLSLYEVSVNLHLFVYAA